MGLDTVELVMDVENHFGIGIQYAEADRIRTVGELVSLIQSRIDAAHLARCPTLSSFLCLRSCARDVTSNGELRIRTGTRIIDVLAPFQRRQLWKRLEVILGSPLPSLRRPPILRKALAAAVLLLIVAAVVAAGAIDWALLPLTLTFAALLSVIMHFSTVRFRVHPPDSLTTFGSIAKRMAGTRVATITRNSKSMSIAAARLR